MAKIFGLFGSMNGKVADVVMAVRNGVQIVRKYQPIVSNPRTNAQIASRARLKLMSQLSAVMAPVIAMPKQGLTSTRNLFVRENYGKSSFADNTASITLTAVSLTKSVVSLPPVVATRSQNAINVVLSDAISLDVDRVVYALFTKLSDGSLRYYGNKIATAPGNDQGWGVSFDVATLDTNFVVYAYGVRDNTDAARAYFGNMQALTAETVAKLVTQRILSESDITLTETRAVEIGATTNANASERSKKKE